MASILNLIVGRSCSWLPTTSTLESSGLSSELPTELPTISVYGGSAQPYLHGKNSNGNSMGSPLRCQLFPHMEVLGRLICMAKFPWATQSTAHWAANFFVFGSYGLPTELPTVSIYGSSGQPYFHCKIPTGSPWADHFVAHVKPMGSKVGSSPVFPYRCISTFVYDENPMLELPTVHYVFSVNVWAANCAAHWSAHRQMLY